METFNHQHLLRTHCISSLMPGWTFPGGLLPALLVPLVHSALAASPAWTLASSLGWAGLLFFPQGFLGLGWLGSVWLCLCGSSRCLYYGLVWLGCLPTCLVYLGLPFRNQVDGCPYIGIQGMPIGAHFAPDGTQCTPFGDPGGQYMSIQPGPHE